MKDFKATISTKMIKELGLDTCMFYAFLEFLLAKGENVEEVDGKKYVIIDQSGLMDLFEITHRHKSNILKALKDSGYIETFDKGFPPRRRVHIVHADMPYEELQPSFKAPINNPQGRNIPKHMRLLKRISNGI